MLCDKCHKIADGRNGSSVEHEEYRQGLLSIAVRQVKNSGHIRNQNDVDFLTKHGKPYL
jgi:hypothetical protein